MASFLETFLVLCMGRIRAPDFYFRSFPALYSAQTVSFFQGFNTGVVLYNLAEMRRSALYNSYLTPAMVTMLEKKYMYGYTLAEQVDMVTRSM